LKGCSRRGWVPTKVQDGVIDATLHLRSHVAVVRISYARDSYSVAYLRSENLNYERTPGGSEMIHANYNSWVRNLNLTRDIAVALDSARVAFTVYCTVAALPSP
jgi:hypothetical protein